MFEKALSTDSNCCNMSSMNWNYVPICVHIDTVNVFVRICLATAIANKRVSPRSMPLHILHTLPLHRQLTIVCCRHCQRHRCCFLRNVVILFCVFVPFPSVYTHCTYCTDTSLENVSLARFISAYLTVNIEQHILQQTLLYYSLVFSITCKTYMVRFLPWPDIKGIYFFSSNILLLLALCIIYSL